MTIQPIYPATPLRLPTGPKTAPFLPMSRREMDVLGWDACDIVLVTGDAYIDHPAFGMALMGRLLEAKGYRVGIIAQPEWRSADAFRELGPPRLFWGVTAGNMDSMVNRYTSDRRIRHDDAYTPDAEGGKRPDRAELVYSQRCREAFKGIPVVMGGIAASLRRVAHFDYWSEKVRRSVLMDAKADLLVFGNGERQIAEIADRLAAGEPISDLTDIRGTAFMRRGRPAGWVEIDSTEVDTPGPLAPPVDPYAMSPTPNAGAKGSAANSAAEPAAPRPFAAMAPEDPDDADIPMAKREALRHPRAQTVIRLPAYEAVVADPVLYAHASRVVHLEANPHNARALVQDHGGRDVWLNPPPLPLATPEMDAVYERPFARVPHPSYGDAKIPAYEMIRFSITIQRGCFGGCTFCSITEHEGRIIQNRSEGSILKEIEHVRDKTPGFTGTISDLGGPTANMYRLACKTREIEASCRKPSCVFPGICPNLDTDHSNLIQLYRKAREIPGVKRILIASGVRYDLAVESPEYVRELATHHVGGYLKIAPEHIAESPLEHMMKPGIGSFHKFKKLFDRYSERAGKKQFLIPYFIAAHPGTTVADMVELAVWLKSEGYRCDQVQAFLPSPMATATAMYHSGKNTLHGIKREGGDVETPKGLKMRRLHKALLRYHDPKGWPDIRVALKRIGREDLIGAGPQHLVPWHDPVPGRYQPSGGRPLKPGAKKQHGQKAQSAPKGGRALSGGAGRMSAKPQAKADGASKAGAGGRSNAGRSGGGRSGGPTRGPSGASGRPKSRGPAGGKRGKKGPRGRG